MIEKYIPGIRCGRAVPTGGVEKMRNGKFRKKTEYKEFFTLPDGSQMEIGQWQKEAMQAVKEDGLLPLFEKVRAHCAELAWLKVKGKEKETDLYALECLIEGSYKYWEGFEEEGEKIYE